MANPAPTAVHSGHTQPRPQSAAPVNHVLARQKSSVQMPSRPLTADEIVRARNKARSAAQAGIGSHPAPKRLHMAGLEAGTE